MVPSALNGCYVSTEFPTFVPSADLLAPRWFHWITKTQGFWQQCDQKSRCQKRQKPDSTRPILGGRHPSPPARRAAPHRKARIQELATRIEEARGLRREAIAELELLERAAIDRAYVLAYGCYGTRRLDELCISITDGNHLTPTFVDSGVKFIFVGNVSSGHLHFRKSASSLHLITTQTSSRSASPNRVTFCTVPLEPPSEFPPSLTQMSSSAFNDT